MRRHYIDNLRILCIFLLFPFHTCMVFNTFNDPFYVFSKPVTACGELVVATYPWWMSLLFALAGISSAYALKKRGGKEYLKERVLKLFIPLLFGVLLIIPPQTYIADVFHNDYTYGYLKHYLVFFTKITDFSGYDGGFTPAHLWFMLYLFIISLIALPIMLYYNKSKKKLDGTKFSIPIILLMFLIVLFMAPILEIGGKSIGESLACFLLGFFVLSLEDVQDKLEKNKVVLGIAWIVLIIVHITLYNIYDGHGLVWDIEYRMLLWVGILAAIGLSKRYLNFNNKFTKYFSPAAFPIYFFHQTVLIIIAFFIIKLTDIIAIQFVLIVLISFILTVGVYEIFRRIPITRFMFGIKKIEKL